MKIMAISIVFCLTLASCNSEKIIVPLDVTSSFEEGLQRWEESSYQNYRYVFRWRCYCAREVDWVEITVREGKVTRVVALESGEPYEVDWAWVKGDFETIDGLFELVREAHDRPADMILEEYDTRHGFPVEVYIDWDEGAADEEIGFIIREVIVEG